MNRIQIVADQYYQTGLEYFNKALESGDRKFFIDAVLEFKKSANNGNIIKLAYRHTQHPAKFEGADLKLALDLLEKIVDNPSRVKIIEISTKTFLLTKPEKR
jgi:hypothetical protein